MTTNLKPTDVHIPADVSQKKQSEYVKNYLNITKSTGRLMLFAGDQKIEHLNNDFYGDNIAPEDNDPEHLFRIASEATIGTFATQYGLIAHYGRDYPSIPYTVKINSKTGVITTDQSDPSSDGLVTVEQALALERDAKLDIAAFGYTVYVGSEHEPRMLHEAAQVVHSAHQNGKLVVIWAYPRGKAVTDEFDPHLIAGAAGVAACLGADFVKVNVPKNIENPMERFQEASVAAGRCGLITAGGSSKPVLEFLQQLYDVVHVAGGIGNATGRNIHQKPLDEAIRLCNAISALTYENKSATEAYKIYQGDSAE